MIEFIRFVKYINYEIKLIKKKTSLINTVKFGKRRVRGRCN
jgi:hypothetical protein